MSTKCVDILESVKCSGIIAYFHRLPFPLFVNIEVKVRKTLNLFVSLESIVFSN